MKSLHHFTGLLRSYHLLEPRAWAVALIGFIALLLLTSGQILPSLIGLALFTLAIKLAKMWKNNLNLNIEE